LLHGGVGSPRTAAGPESVVLYKIGILLFNLVPYVAFLIVG
jgi:hypothetical protein